MGYLAVDKSGEEVIIQDKPFRYNDCCWSSLCDDDGFIYLPEGTIKKILGKELTWEDEPVELKEEEL